jgi:glycosyltransferase involved in cell wall biosynthesis
MNNKIAISINITAHNEGLLLYKTLRAVDSMCKYFSNNHVDKYEVNITLDNPDNETKRVASMFYSEHFKLHIYNVDFGDLALCRNFLVTKSSGEYCTFIDGDDLFSESYLADAYALSMSSKEPRIYSPEYLVSFGEHDYIVKKLDFDSPNFRIINCFETNYFISQSFAHKKIFQEIQYRPNKDGYGMEDWDWNNTAIARGYKFYNVPDNIFFYRRKKQSMITEQVTKKAALRPNELFEPLKFCAYPGYLLEPVAKSVSRGAFKNNLKIIARLGTFGSETIKVYLKDQYMVHKKAVISINKNRQNIATFNRIDLLELDNKCISQWQKINKIEPLIRASNYNLKSIVVGEYKTQSKSALLYHILCKLNTNKGANYNHLVVVPHLIKGGADLAAIRLISALSEIDKKDRTLVISTMDVKSPWAGKLDGLENVDYINPYNEIKGISKDEIEIILLRILQNWSIANLHIINSEVAYNLVINYGGVLGKSIKIFLHTYAFDMDNEGYIYNYIANGLVDSYSRVDKYITDSERYKKELCSINGFDENKISVLKLPVDNSLKFVDRKNNFTKKIFWAGRISDAKIVETAVEIGNRLKAYGIELHFYGHLDHEYTEGNYFEKMISPLSNVYYRGTFDKFEDIPVSKYDAMLFTSKNEGLPNILLEAIATNTFIIASNVGAVCEVITDSINGYLINDIYNADDYTQKIIELYKHDASKDQTTTNKRIISERGFERYKNNISKLLS